MCWPADSLILCSLKNALLNSLTNFSDDHYENWYADHSEVAWNLMSRFKRFSNTTEVRQIACIFYLFLRYLNISKQFLFWKDNLLYFVIFTFLILKNYHLFPFPFRDWTSYCSTFFLWVAKQRAIKTEDTVVKIGYKRRMEIVQICGSLQLFPVSACHLAYFSSIGPSR